MFGWLIKAYNAVATTRERIFLSKAAKFLQSMRNVDERAMEKFHKKLASDASYGQKVGENLILLLDRHDNMDKAPLLGKVFSGYIRGDIEYQMVLRIAAAIDRAFVGD